MLRSPSPIWFWPSVQIANPCTSPPRRTFLVEPRPWSDNRAFYYVYIVR